MTELSKDIVGKKLDQYEYTVERGKIKEFCIAIGETDPIYFNLDEAKKAGYDDIPAPPTFTTVIQFWGYPKIWNDLEAIGIDIKKMLHIKEEYNYLKTIYPGTYKAQPEIIDVKTGKMDMVTFKTIFTNEKNEPVIEAEMAVVIVPAAK